MNSAVVCLYLSTQYDFLSKLFDDRVMACVRDGE